MPIKKNCADINFQEMMGIMRFSSRRAPEHFEEGSPVLSKEVLARLQRSLKHSCLSGPRTYLTALYPSKSGSQPQNVILTSLENVCSNENRS